MNDNYLPPPQTLLYIFIGNDSLPAETYEGRYTIEHDDVAFDVILWEVGDLLDEDLGLRQEWIPVPIGTYSLNRFSFYVEIVD